MLPSFVPHFAVERPHILRLSLIVNLYWVHFWLAQTVHHWFWRLHPFCVCISFVLIALLSHYGTGSTFDRMIVYNFFFAFIGISFVFGNDRLFFGVTVMLQSTRRFFVVICCILLCSSTFAVWFRFHGEICFRVCRVSVAVGPACINLCQISALEDDSNSAHSNQLDWSILFQILQIMCAPTAINMVLTVWLYYSQFNLFIFGYERFLTFLAFSLFEII